MERTTEKTRKIIWVASLIMFGAALFCPTFSTNAGDSHIGGGLVNLGLGWMGAIFAGGTYVAWFANPVFFIAIFTNKSAPILSFFLSIMALAIAYKMLNGGTVLLNEAGHKGYITKLDIGYWLWTSSMILMIIASSLPIIEQIRDYRDQKRKTL